MNYVVIKAGGVGMRMQPCDRPKQFVEVEGKPVIIYTMECFQQNELIDGICVSCISGWEDYLKDFAKKFGITKLKWVVVGGETPQQSIMNGLNAVYPYCNKDDIVIIHDAVRPLVSQKIINQSIENAIEFGASVVTAPCVETMLWSDDRASCTRTYDRSKLFQSRAPQAYNMFELMKTYEEAEKRGIKNSLSTDEIYIDMRKDIKQIVGSVHNIKITTKDDLEMFNAMVKYRKEGQ